MTSHTLRQSTARSSFVTSDPPVTKLMTVFTLTNVCGCGSTIVIGVFDCLEAALERLRSLAACTDPGDEYRIECFELKTFDDEVENTERILRSRAEWKAKQAKLEEDG